VYDVEAWKNPDRVNCNCLGFKNHQRCKHIKYCKYIIDGFFNKKPLAKNPDLNIGTKIKSEVYHSMSKIELGEKQQLVLDCLKKNPDGLTDKGIALVSGLSLSCVNGRRNELMKKGLVVPYTIISYAGEERMIPNIVWGINEE
jgi:hypothetical protein